MKNIKEIFNSIIYSPLYHKLYMLTDNEKVTILNSMSEDVVSIKDRKSLLRLISTEIYNIQEDLTTLGRELKGCKKKKTYITEDEDGNKERVKVDVTKRAFKNEISSYEEKEKTKNEYLDKIQDLYTDVDELSVTSDDIPTLNEILKNHKYNSHLQTVLLSCLTVIVVLLIIYRWIY